jgi:hypothetical protein
MSISFSVVASRPTNHSTGPAQKAAQAGEFKRYEAKAAASKIVENSS